MPDPCNGRGAQSPAVRRRRLMPVEQGASSSSGAARHQAITAEGWHGSPLELVRRSLRTANACGEAQPPSTAAQDRTRPPSWTRFNAPGGLPPDRTLTGGWPVQTLDALLLVPPRRAAAGQISPGFHNTELGVPALQRAATNATRPERTVKPPGMSARCRGATDVEVTTGCGGLARGLEGPGARRQPILRDKSPSEGRWSEHPPRVFIGDRPMRQRPDKARERPLRSSS